MRGSVFLFGAAPLSPIVEITAALLACGPPSLIAGPAAAYLWSALPFAGTPIDIALPRGDRRPAGVRVHRPSVEPESTIHHGLPVTTPHQTLLDLAATQPARTTEQALNEAYAQRLTTPAKLAAFLDHHAAARGSARLNALLQDHDGFTRSKAERLLRDLIHTARLPRPTFNATVERYEVDAHWPAHRLAVEVDGYAAHASRQAFEQDRRKTAALQAHGLAVIRLTWRQLTREPEATVALLARALATAA